MASRTRARTARLMTGFLMKSAAPPPHRLHSQCHVGVCREHDDGDLYAAGIEFPL